MLAVRKDLGSLLTVAPYRISGAVYGVLLNHRDDLAALGDAAHRPPHQAPPQGVVLCIKPRNTLIGVDEAARVDEETPELAVNAALGIIIGRTTCAVTEAQALGHVSGYLAVADFNAANAGHFRPQTRLKARDASCALGQALHRDVLGDAGAVFIRTFVDGRLARTSSTAEHVRSLARLIVDVSDFMTLSPGDVLFSGATIGAPLVRAGQTMAIEIDGLPRLEVRVVAREGEL